MQLSHEGNWDSQKRQSTVCWQGSCWLLGAQEGRQNRRPQLFKKKAVWAKWQEEEAGTDCGGTENRLYLGLSKNFPGDHRVLVGEEQEARLDWQKDHIKEVPNANNARCMQNQRAKSRSSLSHHTFNRQLIIFLKMSVWEAYLSGGWSRLRWIRLQMLSLLKHKCFCEYWPNIWLCVNLMNIRPSLLGFIVCWRDYSLNLPTEDLLCAKGCAKHWGLTVEWSFSLQWEWRNRMTILKAPSVSHEMMFLRKASPRNWHSVQSQGSNWRR